MQYPKQFNKYQHSKCFCSVCHTMCLLANGTVVPRERKERLICDKFTLKDRESCKTEKTLNMILLFLLILFINMT